MRRSQFTPGPWIVESLSFGELNILSADMKMDIATIGSPPSPKDRANARLIAAAPDLLAVVKMVRLGLGDGRMVLFSDAAIAEIEATLAKAEGRP